ncbi:zinc ribbon domain-containing protein [Streptomyces sp. NPDC001793]|uniref:zinc ribbon domain-containing protein n=1 Tax=Streptomyces sp. NPDC001793 TaxID=3154657 RepID=UPI00332EBCA0
MDARTPVLTYTDGTPSRLSLLLAELHPEALPAPTATPLCGGGEMPGAMEDGWSGFFHRAHRLLPAGGLLLLATRQRRDEGILTDPLGSLIACARTAGFRYRQHVIVAHAHPTDDRLIPTPLFVHFGVPLWVPEVGGPIDPKNEAHDLVMSVFGGMSKGERNRIKIRVHTVMASQAKIEGRYLGGRPPYGYRIADAGPHPNPAKAADGKRLHRLEPDPAQARRHKRSQDRTTERSPRTTTRPYALRGRIRCSLCQRKMQGTFNHGHPHYRCRYPSEYAKNEAFDHPLAVYVREAPILGELDKWIATVFAPGRFKATLHAMQQAQRALVAAEPDLGVARRAPSLNVTGASPSTGPPSTQAPTPQPSPAGSARRRPTKPPHNTSWPQPEPHSAQS